jgi:hypothetical protein
MGSQQSFVGSGEFQAVAVPALGHTLTRARVLPGLHLSHRWQSGGYTG